MARLQSHQLIPEPHLSTSNLSLHEADWNYLVQEEPVDDIINFSMTGKALKSLESPSATQAIHIPLIRPTPPRLSRHMRELAAIEESGTYSNYGPVNTRFEQELVSTMFQEGECVTVCNATIGLMMAIREVIGEDRPAARKYALMPSLTFAATAHAAIWAGLTPLLCDADPNTWLPSEESEEALLRQYKGQVAVIVPYATFGNNLDLDRYEKMSARHGVPVVVDAAASLGSIDQRGRSFGSGFSWPVVFSMHATKLFATGEGGVIYSGDTNLIGRLRAMGSFGFEHTRSASMLGINSKLSEVAALTGLLKLRSFSKAVLGKQILSDFYTRELSGHFELQQQCGRRQARAFESILLPRSQAPFRGQIIADLRTLGIGAGTYFSPHLAEHPYFQKHAVSGALPETEDVASRILTLPLFEGMVAADVKFVAAALRKRASAAA